MVRDTPEKIIDHFSDSHVAVIRSVTLDHPLSSTGETAHLELTTGMDAVEDGEAIETLPQAAHVEPCSFTPSRTSASQVRGKHPHDSRAIS